MAQVMQNEEECYYPFYYPYILICHCNKCGHELSTEFSESE